MGDDSTSAEPSKALVRFASQIEKIHDGVISFDDLVKEVAPDPEPIKRPEKLPTVAVITAKERAAIKKLPDVFGKVVPTERRALTDDELVAIVEERETFDVIDAMTKKRRDDLRTTVFNHFDVKDEAAGRAKADTPIEEKTGHYVLADEAPVPEMGKRWVRQVSENAPRLAAEKLAALLGDPQALSVLEAQGVTFDNETYLAMTRQTRVFDQEATMILLRKRPELVAVIAAASQAGGKTASLYLRNLK